MYRLLLWVCLTGVVFAKSAQFSKSKNLTDIHEVAECVTEGIMCETCQTSVMCVKKNDKEFIKMGRFNCPDGYTCFGGQCTRKVNPKCDYINFEFPCQYQGVFPDPGDWTKYYFCVPTGPDTYKSFEAKCEPEAAYNPKSTYCDQLLADKQPDELPVPICDGLDLNPKALDSNPTIYYRCMPYANTGKIYPFQSACLRGGSAEGGLCKIQSSNNIIYYNITSSKYIN